MLLTEENQKLAEKLSSLKFCPLQMPHISAKEVKTGKKKLLRNVRVMTMPQINYSHRYINCLLAKSQYVPFRFYSLLLRRIQINSTQTSTIFAKRNTE